MKYILTTKYAHGGDYLDEFYNLSEVEKQINYITSEVNMEQPDNRRLLAEELNIQVEFEEVK